MGTGAAIVIGGAVDWRREYLEALMLCDTDVELWVCNDQIETFEGWAHHGVTLHPPKLPVWLAMRKHMCRKRIDRIWCHRPSAGVTDVVGDRKGDWKGSVGLHAARCALSVGHTKVILCGVPMTPEGGHYIRGKAPWKDCLGFRPGWLAHLDVLSGKVKSYSGWTKELLGEPTEEWLRAT